MAKDINYWMQYKAKPAAQGNKNSDYWLKYKKNTALKDKEESTGLSGVLDDFETGALNAIPAIATGLYNLPGELKGAGAQVMDDIRNPLTAGSRFQRNILAGFGKVGHGLLSTPGNARDYLARKKLISQNAPSFRLPESILPKDFDYAQGVGLEGNQSGDALLQSAPEAALYGSAGELGQLASLNRNIARAGAGALAGIGNNQSPVETALMYAGIPFGAEQIAKMPLPGKSWQQFKANREANIANNALDKARRDLPSRGTLTPEQAIQNRLLNYTNIEGQPMPVDIGTLLGNQTVKDMYNVSSKIPFSGGRQTINELVAQGFDKSEAIAQLKHDRDMSANVAQRQSYENQLRQAQEHIQLNDRAHSQRNDSMRALQGLQHPDIPHNTLIKQELTSALNDAKSEASEAYRPFNELNVDLNTMRMPSDFNSRYRQAYNELQESSDNLNQLFGDDRDLGRRVSAEVRAANEFFGIPESTGSAQDVAVAGQLRLNRATPEAITSHIRNLQSLAAEAFSAGKHIESAALKKMASALKSDMKSILRHNDYNEAVDALEQGDKIFQKEVLPFYNHREIKKIASERAHELTDTSRVSVSNALHQPNFQAILNRLSPPAQKATIYETITKGKYGDSGHNMTPAKLETAYSSIRNNARQSFGQINPSLVHSLENLPVANEVYHDTRNASDHAVRANEQIQRLREQEHALKSSLSDTLKKRFGKSTATVKPITSALKNISPLNSAGLGVMLYALHNLPKKLLAEGLGFSIPAAKLMNKALTNPELLNHYVNNTRVTPRHIEQNALESRVRNTIRQLSKTGAATEQTRNKNGEY